jgi:hypothetical protein
MSKVLYPVEEAKAVLKRIEGVQIWDMRVKGVDPDGNAFVQPIEYFDVNGTGKIEDMIDNLFETCYLNPPQKMELLTPKDTISIY